MMRVNISLAEINPMNVDEMPSVSPQAAQDAASVEDCIELLARLIAKDAVQGVNALLSLGVKDMKFKIEDYSLEIGEFALDEDKTFEVKKQCSNIYSLLVEVLWLSKRDEELDIDWGKLTSETVDILERKFVPYERSRFSNDLIDRLYYDILSENVSKFDAAQRDIGRVALKIIKNASQGEYSKQMNLFQAFKWDMKPQLVKGGLQA